MYIILLKNLALIIKSSESNISHQSTNTIAILPLLVFIAIFVLFDLTTKIIKYTVHLSLSI